MREINVVMRDLTPIGPLFHYVCPEDGKTWSCDVIASVDKDDQVYEGILMGIELQKRCSCGEEIVELIEDEMVVAYAVFEDALDSPIDAIKAAALG